MSVEVHGRANGSKYQNSLHDKSNTSIMSAMPHDEPIGAHKHHEEKPRANWWDEMIDEKNLQGFREGLDMLLARRTETIQGHLGSVIAVAIHSDDKLMITGGFDSLLRVWDLERDTCIKTIKGHKGCINAIEILYPFGMFASAGSDGLMLLWSIKTLTLMVKIDTEHINGISDMCISRNYSSLWTSGYDGVVKCWTISDSSGVTMEGIVYQSNKSAIKQINAMVGNSTDEFLCLAKQDKTIVIVSANSDRVYDTLKGHKMPVQCLAINREDSILFSGGSDNSLRIWKLGNPAECIKVIENLEASVMNLALSMDQSCLLISCAKEVLCYDTASWKVKKTYTAHKAEIYSLYVYPGMNIFVTGSMDKTLKFWGMDDDFLCLKTIEGHSDSIRCLELSPDGSLLFTGGYDNNVKIWDLKNRSCIATLEGHEACVTDLAFSESNELLFTSSKDGSFKAWSIKNSKCVATYRDSDSNYPIYSIALLSKAQLMVTALKHTDIAVWDINNKSVKGRLIGHTGPVNAICASKNEKFLYSGGEDMELILWDMKNFRPLRRFGKEGHSKPISCIALDRESKFLATGSEDKSIKVWNLDEFSMVKSFSDHKDVITSLSFSMRKDIMYSTSLDGFFKIWDMAQMNSITSLGSPTIPVNGMCFNLDESKLYLAASDSSIRMLSMNIDIGETRLEGHKGKIHDVICVDTPSGKSLITSGEDKTIREWDINTNEVRRSVESKQVMYCMQMAQDFRLYCGAEDSKVRVFQMNFNEPAKGSNNNFFQGQHDDVITCMCMTREQDIIFTGSARNDQVIRAWSVKSQTLLYELKGTEGSITKLRVNHAGTKLFVASTNSLIKIFELSSKDAISVLKGHRGTINDIVLSHDEMYLYSGGADHSIKAWNLFDETVMETYKEHTDEVLCLLYAKTNQHLISSGKDRYINIYITIDGSCIFRFKYSDENISCIELCAETHTLYGGGDHHLNSFSFHNYGSKDELDGISLESLNHYLQADTNADKTKELINFVEGLKLKNNLYYTHRVNPIMFLANLPFTTILRYALNTFKYPKFVFEYQDDLLYRTLVDVDKRNNHLNTVCEYLIDNPKEIYLHQKTVEEMMKFHNNVKIQKLLTVLFNSAVKGQEGGHLIFKGKLKSDPIMRKTNYIDTIPRSLNKEMIKNESKLYEISYRITKFPLNMHNGTTFSLFFFKGLAKCMKDVILSDMKHIINYKWSRIKKYLVIHSIIFWVFTLCLVWHLVFEPESYILLVMCLITGTMIVSYELISAKGNFVGYLFDDLNWLDVLCIVLSFVTLFLLWYGEGHYIFGISAFVIFFVMMRALTYFRIFDSMRHLISLSLRVVFDMIPFLIVSFAFVLTFAMMSAVMRKMDTEDQDPKRRVFFNIFTHYTLIFYKKMNFDDYVWYDWLMFAWCSTFLSVMLLTLLVSIVDETCETFTSATNFFDIYEKLSIISDYDNFLHNLRVNRHRENDFANFILAFHPQEIDDPEYEHLRQLEANADAVCIKIALLELNGQAAAQKLLQALKDQQAFEEENEDIEDMQGLDDINARTVSASPMVNAVPQTEAAKLDQYASLRNDPRSNHAESLAEIGVDLNRPSSSELGGKKQQGYDFKNMLKTRIEAINEVEDKLQYRGTAQERDLAKSELKQLKDESATARHVSEYQGISNQDISNITGQEVSNTSDVVRDIISQKKSNQLDIEVKKGANDV